MNVSTGEGMLITFLTLFIGMKAFPTAEVKHSYDELWLVKYGAFAAIQVEANKGDRCNRVP